MVVVLGITVAGYYKSNPYLYKPYPLPSPSHDERSSGR